MERIHILLFVETSLDDFALEVQSFDQIEELKANPSGVKTKVDCYHHKSTLNAV